MLGVDLAMHGPDADDRGAVRVFASVARARGRVRPRLGVGPGWRVDGDTRTQVLAARLGCDVELAGGDVAPRLWATASAEAATDRSVTASAGLALSITFGDA